jgi:hypothetical protein
MLAADAELQWWHQRAVHEAFGIAEGFDLSLTADGASVLVAPGVAFDCFGRDVHLGQERVLAVPEGDERMTLLARPRRMCAHRDADRGCGGADEPELEWVPTTRMDVRTGVPLGTYDAKRARTLRSDVQRTRSLARPRVWAGATPESGTPWLPFARFSVERGIWGLEVRVDTQAAGFTDTPCYFAWLRWPRVGSWKQSSEVTVALGRQYVERPTINGFTFRVWLDVRGLLPAGEALAFARRERLCVSWLGVQCDRPDRVNPNRRKP